MDERVEPGKTEIGNVRRHIARYNLALALCVDKNVLDLACGTGYGTDLISQVSKSVTGVDISRDAILKAESRYDPEINSNMEFKICEAVLYLKEWNPNLFDTMVCFETIEHLSVESFNVFVRNIGNKIKNGGHIIYSVPLDEEQGWNPHHKQVFTLETAREIFNLKFVDEFIQVGLNFYRMGENLPEGKRFYIGIRIV